MHHVCSAIILLLISVSGYSQKIVDPCFASIDSLGFFHGSEDVKNVCPKCKDPFLATDRLQWNGTEWEGEVPSNDIELPPPPGCSDRALWMGIWTFGGEAIALRLDKPLQSGISYTYTFTYASVGAGGDHNFSPLFYTYSDSDISKALLIGRLPGTAGWATNSFTFTAGSNQAGHTWIFLHAFESSGIIMGQCDLKQLYPENMKLLGDDQFICEGEKIKLTLPLPVNTSYEYSWSNGLEDPAIFVQEPGAYSVNLRYGNCEAKDTIQITSQDCDVRLVMPNVFTPNGDDINEWFLPKEHNFIIEGTTLIYNRWGKTIFTGDLFTGWNGKSDDSSESASGIYYYTVVFTDGRQRKHSIKGHLTLLR